MKYENLNSELFIDNRNRFRKSIKKNSVAVFNSNDIMPTNADGHMGFTQNSDLFWMSGIDQEESILVIAPDTKMEGHQEVLFLRETNEIIEVWEGHKYTKEEATKVSGISKIYWLKDFDTVFNSLMCETENVYLNTNEHTRATIEVETRDARFVKWCLQKYPLHKYERTAPIMHELRAIKNKYEIELIQKACDITEKGFRRVLNFLKPGVMEYNLEAEFLHEFINNRSKGFAYGPIVASGKNACVLHYTQNNMECKEGELILFDVAAEYANYASDMTRCLPVNGKFSARQKDVYNAVLRVMRSAINRLVVGNTWDNYHKEVGVMMEKELIGLGLLDAEKVKKQDVNRPLYKKYFMHGTSHFLGLDVHDIGNKYQPFKAGMVFTCEPGIYIPEEGLGIRIENNILITDNGPIDLMKNIPVEVEEIEALMAK